MLNAAADDVSLRYGDDVRDTVTGIDHRASEGALGDLSATAADHEKKKKVLSNVKLSSVSHSSGDTKKYIYLCTVAVVVAANTAVAETLTCCPYCCCCCCCVIVVHPTLLSSTSLLLP